MIVGERITHMVKFLLVSNDRWRDLKMILKSVLQLFFAIQSIWKCSITKVIRVIHILRCKFAYLPFTVSCQFQVWNRAFGRVYSIKHEGQVKKSIEVQHFCLN